MSNILCTGGSRISQTRRMGHNFITARKRSLRGLCFYRCLSFCPRWGGGMRGLLQGACVVAGGVCMVASRGGMHGCSGGEGACMVALGGHAWLLLGGHVWLLLGGMLGCSRGAYMVAPGGVCGCSGGRAWFFRWDTVNEQTVRILLECILVWAWKAIICHNFFSENCMKMKENGPRGEGVPNALMTCKAFLTIVLVESWSTVIVT